MPTFFSFCFFFPFSFYNLTISPKDGNVVAPVSRAQPEVLRIEGLTWILANAWSCFNGKVRHLHFLIDFHGANFNSSACIISGVFGRSWFRYMI